MMTRPMSPPTRQVIRVGAATFYQGGRRSQEEFEAAGRQLLDEGKAFEAYDLIRIGLEQFPASVRLRQAAARALLRTGAPEEARPILEGLCRRAPSHPGKAQRLFAALRTTLDELALDRERAEPSGATLAALSDAIDEIGAGTGAGAPVARDAETFGLLGRVYKELWQAGSREDGERSREVYLEGFNETGDYYPGINAATMAWLLGDRPGARALARRVLEVCAPQLARDDSDRYWRLATLAEANLLLESASEARRAYAEAVALAHERRQHALVVSSYQQLQLLRRHGLPVPDDLLAMMRPPTVVVFTGHMADAPDRVSPRFPRTLEADVRRRIDERLEALDARVGFASAACGADLIFIEAMFARGADIHIVLPSAEDDFIRTSVRPGGEHWVARYRNALRMAASVTHATEENLLQDDSLFAFANSVMVGLADLRAQSLATQPRLLAVWDGQPGGRGGTADMVASWRARDQVDIIPLTAAAPTRRRPRVAKVASRGKNAAARREVKALLFADVVGFSKLEEAQAPSFMRAFLQELASKLERVRPKFLNTWGDGIFAVEATAMRMAEFALRLTETVERTDWDRHGLPQRMQVRVALHAGPVFHGMDALARRPNYYGSHVNRAARIEPITLPGRVYASEQFVGLLLAEQSLAGRARRYACANVGTVPLAKGFGTLHLYHLARATRM